MTATLLIAWSPGEVRGIVTVAGRAVELRVERDLTASLIGARFIGRVVRVMPALNAAFVDIGVGSPAFLPLRQRASQPLTEGAAIAVTVSRDAQGTKPPELRTLPPADAGEFSTAPVPRRLDAPRPAVMRLLASLEDVPVDAVIVNDADALLEVRRYCRGVRPALADHVALEAGGDLFAAHDLDEAFADALASQVMLETGGRVHFEATAAALMIDVDLAQAATTGGKLDRAILATNLAAAAAIGRQLRLRGVGGAVVVDFISMRDKAARQQVWDALAQAVAADPVPVELHGWTRLGHLELTRRRGRTPLAEVMLEPAAVTPTAATVALDALARICFARPQPGQITLGVAPEVADLLEGALAETLGHAIRRSGRRVIVERRSGQHRGAITIDGI